MTRRTDLRAYLINRIFIPSGKGMMVLIAAQFLSQPSAAQLKAWDHSNTVLVDLSVLGVGDTGHRVDTATRVLLPSLGETLLAPPRRMPISRLLAPRPPTEGVRLERELRTVKLVPPSELRKRWRTCWHPLLHPPDLHHPPFVIRLVWMYEIPLLFFAFYRKS